jgi:hypothetical protein
VIFGAFCAGYPMTSRNPFPVWPFFPFLAPWSFEDKSPDVSPVSENSQNALPAPAQQQRANVEGHESASGDYGPWLDMLGRSLRSASLSLTALSTRAEAMFAQLAAALAFDRALREARRAQETLRDLLFAPTSPPRKQPLAESLPFADSAGLLLQGMSAAFSFWSLAPFAVWNSAQASEGRSPAKQASPFFSVWPYFNPQPRGAQAKGDAGPAVLNPFGAFSFGWTPSLLGFWPAAA